MGKTRGTAHLVTFTEDEQFFYDHAGWGYRPGEESPTSGRSRGAILLAMAEREMKARGWEVRWEDEDQPWDGEVPHDGPLLWGRLVTAKGNPSGYSLGMVAVNSHDDPYLRVVAAEMALEALSVRKM